MSRKITVSDSTYYLLERMRVDANEESIEELILCLLYEALPAEMKDEELWLDRVVQ